jgi:hypothetical protein
MDDRLSETLIEIARIEGELRAHGDHSRLKAFGDARRGAALAETIGYDRGISDEDARRVDQLSLMPDALALVRDYLRTLTERQAPSSWSSGAVSRGS